jgi:predicted DNA-binding transcriptional regulator YafY
MKSDRLVSLMLLLQARSRRSARDLSEALEVSIRTIYRDVEALSTAGVPIYAERGSNGGIVLADGYRQAIAQFSTDELHALFVTATDPLADLGVRGHEHALHKLEGALPDLQRRAARKARERVLLDHNRWYRSQQPAEVLAALRRAVWDERQLRMQYRDRIGTATTRIIEPLGLVSKAGVWYLIAREPQGELRTFRAERIVSIEELPTRFERPADFDLETYWRSSQTAMERPSETYEAVIDVQKDALEMVTAFWECEALGEGDGAKTLRVRFPSYRNAVSQIAGWGAHVRVTQPAELRDAVIEYARELLRSYSVMEP